MSDNSGFQRAIRYTIFACICVAVILPSLMISFFQTERFANESIQRFHQHLETLLQQFDHSPLPPKSMVDLLQVNELVLWSRFYSGNNILAQSGLVSIPKNKSALETRIIDIQRPLVKQIPVSAQWPIDEKIYRLQIPIKSNPEHGEHLEIGLSFKPLSALQKSVFSISVVLFLTTFLFLVLIYIFIDTYVVFLIERLVNPSAGRLPARIPFLAPLLQNLVHAIKGYSSMLSGERNARIALETFNKELNRQLEDQRQRLEQSHRQLIQSTKLAAIGELAGGVAHEINNPNGVILAGTKHLQYLLGQESSPPPKYVNTYLDRIVRQSSRIAEIVHALLTFSRRRPQDKQPISLDLPIKDALELACHRFKNIQYECILPADLPIIHGNRNELAQVFLNLFNNAIDAMPTGGKISVSSQLDGKTLQNQKLKVLVHNTGENIPNDILTKIMEPFFTTKPLGKGTGLGLSVSLGIIEEHGGTMKARNHEQGGAVFEIMLPVFGSPKSIPE